MSSAVVLSFLFLFIFYAENVHRGKRFLIYPQSAPTRHQFITGIGIPVELEEQSVTVGYVFKAEFYLPYNANIWRTYPIIPEFREKRNSLKFREGSDLDNITIFKKFKNVRNGDSRWEIYKVLEYLIKTISVYKNPLFTFSVQRSGKECLLLIICEYAQLSFKCHDQSLLGEIMHVFLTPSYSQAAMEDHLQNIYLDAENFGKSGKICQKKFNECTF